MIAYPTSIPPPQVLAHTTLILFRDPSLREGTHGNKSNLSLSQWFHSSCQGGHVLKLGPRKYDRKEAWQTSRKGFFVLKEKCPFSSGSCCLDLMNGRVGHLGLVRRTCLRALGSWFPGIYMCGCVDAPVWVEALIYKAVSFFRTWTKLLHSTSLPRRGSSLLPDMEMAPPKRLWKNQYTAKLLTTFIIIIIST